MKTKFFEPFQIFYLVEKQAYKLKLLKKGKIYNVFYISLLEQDTTRKGQIDENDTTELDAGNNKSGEYKVEIICNSAVYARESKSDYLPGLFYLIFWKGYLEEKNI